MTTKKHLFRIRCWWWCKSTSLLSLTLTFTLVVMMIQSSSAKPCIKVTNFFALRKRIASAPAGTSLNFCPFTVTKPRRASIYVKKSVGIKCNRARKCAIEGAGTHLRIVGPDAKLTLRGFAFRGATKTAVVIAATSKLQHAFFACSFGRNNCFGRVSKGGAIRMATGTSLKVVGGRFFRNRAKAGAGVFVDSGSSLILTKCEFNYNTARGLGIVQVEADARAEISGGLTSFHRNAVENKALGGAIVAVNVGDAVIKSTVAGKLNSGCSGLSIRSQPRCYPFSKIPFELGVLNLEEFGISLSQGLSIELVARSSENVTMTSPQSPRALSTIPFHKLPDGAAVFPLPGGDGSYVYTSNSELSGNGGVYGLVFDSRGRPKDYKMLLEGTNRNCNGGKTPWGTWVSCEEYPGGQCVQVDPTGVKAPENTAIGGQDGGLFEAFAADYRDESNPSFFVTEDKQKGALRRFKPADDTSSGWDLLHGNGTIQYLEFLPGNKFQWTSSHNRGETSADENYRNSEGIAHDGDGKLMFISKVQKQLFVLDLDRNTYTAESTNVGALPGGGSFGGQPDQIVQSGTGLVYFTEEDGSKPGIFTYDGTTWKTLLEADYSDKDETTGVDFSPDGYSLFFCLQDSGLMFQLRRVDGLPFQGQHVLQWKYDLGRRRY